jgi:vancomycin resistance protein YoaR
VEYEYPRPGTGIDREAAAAILAEAILDPARPAVELPTRSLQPVLTAADIDAVVARAESLLSGPVTLWNQEVDRRIEIPRSVLALSLEIERDDTGEIPTFGFSWADGPLREWVESRLVARSTVARDARLVIEDDDTVRIIPSIPPQQPDLEPLAAQVADAVSSVTRVGPLAYEPTGEAQVTTADIEALGIREKISEFTTFHNCCENRVINIQTIADAVDGAMVMPGETFSLNDHVGQRTTAKGYVRAGAIIGGVVQCCDSPINIGGGTSQFTTTLYNAVFYGGLEDVYHFPHTIFFSRYPEGIEATIGFPSPDLVFRNNTQSVLLIRTEYTPTSITVKFFGDNGGLEVEAEKSGRYNYTGPITTYEKVKDPDLCGGRDGTTRIKERGSGGWTIDVYRHITYPEGHYTKPEGGTETEKWVVRYQGGFKVIEYDTDKCKKKGGGEENGGE